MQYEVDVNGRVRRVNVHRTDGRFVVSVDGRECSVDATRVDAHTLSMLIDGASYEVTIVPDAATGQLAVTVGTLRLPVALNSRRGWARRDDGGARGVGPERLLAPMPGKVVRILVKPGDQVQRRQALVVVEAMKMENELRAARDGRVSEIFVKEGQSVDAGAPLLVVAVP